MASFYSLSDDERLKVDTQIYNEIRAKKNGEYSKKYPERRETLDTLVEQGYQLEVSF
jgi:hypothetical protein